MVDLNTMIREQAVTGLQVQLDAAVTAGDTEAARKVSKQMTDLALATAPPAQVDVQAAIRAELDKQPWYGTDPKKSAKAIEFGKTMDPKKFETPKAFADAIIKAVDEEFKAAPAPGEDDEDNTDAPGEDDDAEDPPAAKPRRRTDAPGEGDTLNRSGPKKSGPWTKLADAPADVQKEIRRQSSKLVPAAATKEQRAKFEESALGVAYANRKGAKK